MDLHEYEAAILPHIASCASVEELEKASGLPAIKVMRGLQWLSNKGLVDLEYHEHELVELDVNGKMYREKGLPENRFLSALNANEFIPLDAVMQKGGLDKQEAGVSVGVLKKKAAIETRNTDGILEIKRTQAGTKQLEKDSLEQQLLARNYPLRVDDLEPQERFALDALKSRKQIIRIERKKTPSFSLSAQGKKMDMSAVQQQSGATGISRLTPAMLRDGSWKDKTFRAFDVAGKVPALHGAKRHYVPLAIDYIKRVWLEMGFTQMEGDMIQTAFWDLDSLFVPQDHPARAMQDTFYLDSPSKGSIPPAIAKKVKKAHETGVDGSTGWGSSWSKKEAEQLMLRTHNTVLSAQTISKLKAGDLPAKFFSVGRVFRNETMDASHIFEFYQVEGIVVDPEVNFQHLLGYLKAFFKKLGYPDVRIRPGYFPYTEPSAEVDVWHPYHNKWMELGGSGIFRPEVVEPLLGKPVPVLAWGLGLERSIMEYLDITDIRDIYRNDIKKIQEKKYWTR